MKEYLETDEYIYPQGIYGEVIMVKCKKHSFLFQTTLNDHLEIGGCPICKKNKKGLSFILNNKLKNFFKYKRYYDRQNL